MIRRIDIPVKAGRLFFLLLLSVAVCIFGIIFPLKPLFAEESVCARVKIEIKQEMTFERQAFDAHMQISNGLTTISLQNIKVDVLFSDEQGEAVRASSDSNDADALFYIRISSMAGIDDVTGSGTIEPGTKGDIHWLIIPAPASVQAAPTGALYFVGARLSYLLGGEEHITEVTPDYITVKPLPLLSLDYFLPDEVYGDDPFTIDEEPSIPFSLGVRITNNGHGMASDVKIDSAQPKIIDNEQGLAVDFLIEGSEVDGVTAPDTLLIKFGDIAPETSTIGRWLMTCSLSGRFVEFKAEYSHSNELGGELTSLLEDVSTHFLVQDVLVDAPGRDGIRDFLGRDNDVFKVYESDAGVSEVADLSDSSSVALISSVSGRAKYAVDVSPTAGFFYLNFTDPEGGKKIISDVIRSDGKVLKAQNGWLSKKRVDSDWFFYANIFDYNSTGSYQLTLIDPGLAPKPPAFDKQDDPVQKEGEEVSFIISLEGDPAAGVAGLRLFSASSVDIASAKDSQCDGKTKITTGRLPVGATLVDRCDGTAILIWTPQAGQAGNYPLTFTATDGEFSTTVRYHLVVTGADNTPTAKFGADITSGKVPLSVLFIDDSLSEDGISSWLWDFGDGSTSTEQVPTHTYDVAGLYSVSLKVTEIDGDEDSLTQKDYIKAEAEQDEFPVEFGRMAASSDWQIIPLGRQYKDPVIVATVVNGPVGAIYFVRIRAVSATEFQVRVETDQPLTGQNLGEITYLAAESGDHTLPDGTIISARHIQSPEDGSSVSQTFSTTFPLAPVVVATVASDNELAVVAPVISNISENGFELKIQSEDGLSLAHGSERVDFIAWQPGAGFSAGTLFEAGYLQDVHEPWESYVFDEQFAAPPFFVAAKQARTDTSHTVALYRNLDTFGVDARVTKTFPDGDSRELSPVAVGFIAVSTLSDELDSDGDGITDQEERLVYATHPGKADTDLDGIGDYDELVYWDTLWSSDSDNDGVINLLDIDSDNDGFRDGLEILHGYDPADADNYPTSPIMEFGRLTVSYDWQTVDLNSGYLDPVVVATITESTQKKSYVNIRNISKGSFQLRTTSGSEEEVSYIVMEKAHYRLDDGTLIIADFSEAAPSDRRLTYRFADNFAAIPVVMVSLVSANGPEPISVILRKVRKKRFVFSLLTDKSMGRSEVVERIGFIAWEPSAGFAGDFSFEVSYFDHVRKWWQEYQFDSPLYGLQALVAIPQKSKKKRPGQLYLRNLNPSGIEARLAKSGKMGRGRSSVGFISLSTLPIDLDSDGDGLTDRDEIGIYGTNPVVADTDADGINDGDEVISWGEGWDADIDNDGLISILDIDSDDDGYNDGLEFMHGFDPADDQDLPDGPILGVGEIFVASAWQQVLFAGEYLDPVIVATRAGRKFSPSVVRLKNIGSTGFEIRLVGGEGNSSAPAIVSYIVMERGIYTLPDGKKVIAEHSSVDGGNMYAMDAFPRTFATPPVIITAIISSSEQDPVAIGPFGIWRNMFSIGLHNSRGYTFINDPVGFDYIAWEPSAGETDSMFFQVKRFKRVRQKWRRYSFSQTFPSPPFLLAMPQQFKGFRPSTLLMRNGSETGVEMRIFKDSWRRKFFMNLPEAVGIIAISGK